MASSSSTYESDNTHFVDDFYFSALSNEEELLPISDDKYAEELQFQEVLMSSILTNPHHHPQDSQEFSIGSVKNSTQNQNPSIGGSGGESSESFCDICMEPKSRQEIFQTRNCAHAFCTECMSRHVGAKIQENIMLVRCPGLNCKGVIEPEHCRHLVPTQVFERWEKALLESTIDVSQRIYCPFQDCSALLIDDGGDVERESECPNCHRLFCARCKVPWHSGVECEEYLRLGLGENERGKYDLMVLELAKKNMWRRCPTCNFYVEKIDGCLHITCRCGFQFCYGCGGSWPSCHC